MADDRREVLALILGVFLCFAALVALLVTSHMRLTPPEGSDDNPTCWEDEVLYPQGPDGELRCVPIDDF